MPFYNRDFLVKDPAGERTTERLLALRARLRDPLHGVPKRTQEDTLLLATWNLRDFDKPAFGRRSDEAESSSRAFYQEGDGRQQFEISDPRRERARLGSEDRGRVAGRGRG